MDGFGSDDHWVSSGIEPNSRNTVQGFSCSLCLVLLCLDIDFTITVATWRCIKDQRIVFQFICGNKHITQANEAVKYVHRLKK